jgi:hypothetical protein
VDTTGLAKGLHSTQVVVASDTTGLSSVVYFGVTHARCTGDGNLCVSCPTTCPGNPSGPCPEPCQGNGPPTSTVPATMSAVVGCATTRTTSRST